MTPLSSAESLHAQVARRYRLLIRSGKLRPGQRLRPLREIARRLGASITPVNTAFKALEQEGLIHRRHGVGVFVGSPRRHLPATLEVGVLFRPIPGWREHDNYALRLFMGIHQVLQREEHRTLLVTVPYAKRPISELPPQFQESPAHGYVVDEIFSDETVARLAAAGRPVVVVNRGSDVPAAAAVYRDNRQAGAEAARQMLARGHTVVGCVAHKSWNDTETVSGFLEAMAEAGAAVPASRVAVYDGATEEGRGYFRKVMASAPVPTAVCCSTDRLARSFYRWASDVGLRIPQHVSVAGSMDLRLAAQLEPPLTTFRFDPEEIGRRAVQELIGLCRDPGKQPRSVVVSGEWIERESLGNAP